MAFEGFTSKTQKPSSSYYIRFAIICIARNIFNGIFLYIKSQFIHSFINSKSAISNNPFFDRKTDKVKGHKTIFNMQVHRLQLSQL